MDDGLNSRPPHKTATGGSIPIDPPPYTPLPIDAHILADGSATIAAPVFVVGHSQRRSQCPRLR